MVWHGRGYDSVRVVYGRAGGGVVTTIQGWKMFSGIWDSIYLLSWNGIDFSSGFLSSFFLGLFLMGGWDNGLIAIRHFHFRQDFSIRSQNVCGGKGKRRMLTQA